MTLEKPIDLTEYWKLELAASLMAVDVALSALENLRERYEEEGEEENE